MERKVRALRERIYLLSAKQQNEYKWEFVVLGTSRRSYDVTISNNSLSCNCPDCQKRHRICKHIYFIVGRIAQDEETLQRMNNNLGSNIYEICPTLNEKLNDRLFSTEVVSKKQTIAPRYTTCTICFEDMENVEALAKEVRVESEALATFGCVECCGICRNGYHTECIKIWTQKNTTCPCCRSPWLGNDSPNELEYFKLINSSTQVART